MDSDHDFTATADCSCPFCGEDYDVLGLCLHIDDEHPDDAKAGVCPVTPCSKKVGVDIVGHINTEYANLYKVQRRRRYHKGGSNSTISMLRKKFRENRIHSIYGGSFVKAHNAEPDPLLSSFIKGFLKGDQCSRRSKRRLRASQSLCKGWCYGPYSAMHEKNGDNGRKLMRKREAV